MLAVVPGKLIVQQWRSVHFGKNDPDSFSFSFRPGRPARANDLAHINVPKREITRKVIEGWPKHYWKPLRQYLKSGGGDPDRHSRALLCDTGGSVYLLPVPGKGAHQSQAGDGCVTPGDELRHSAVVRDERSSDSAARRNSPRAAEREIRSNTRRTERASRRLRRTLLISTYQAGSSRVQRARGPVDLSFHNFERVMASPSGREAAWGRIADLVLKRRARHRPAPSAAGPHDACFSRDRRITHGEIQVHEMAFAGRTLDRHTLFSCLCTLDSNHSFVPPWKAAVHHIQARARYRLPSQRLHAR